MKYILILFLSIYIISSQAQQSQEIIYMYDEAGRLIQETRIGGNVTAYRFDKTTNREEVAITASSLPLDLIPADPMPGNSILASGAVLSLGYSIQNTGSQAAGFSRTKFYLNQTNQIAGAIVLDSLIHNSLQPGVTAVSRSIPLPADLDAGFWHLIIQVDADSAVTESNEGNNLISTAVTIIDCYGLTVNTTVMSHEACHLSNGSIQALASGGINPVVYAWNTLPSQVSDIADGLSAGIYTVTATDGNGCTASHSDVIINTGESPVSAFEIDSVNGLTIFFDGIDPGNITSFLWNFGNGSIAATADPAYTFSYPGSYEVCLTVGNECGIDQTCLPIVVSDMGCAIPSEFTVHPDTDTSLAITWSFIPGADSFDLRYRITGDSGWTVVSIATHYAHLSSLIPGQLYEYQLQSFCPAGASSWSEMHYFFTNDSEYYDNDRFVAAYYVVNRWCTHLLQLPAGDMVAFGGKSREAGSGRVPVVFRMTSGGHVIWQKNFGLTLHNIGIHKSSDGHIICFLWYNSITYMVKLNVETGEVIWSKYLPYIASGDLAVTMDGGFFYLTYYDQISGPTRLFTLVKLTQDGSIIWSRSFNQSTSANKPTIKVIKVHNSKIYVGGGFVVGGSASYFIARFSSNGVFEWRKFLDEGGYDNYIFDLEFDSADNIYYIGSSETANRLAYGKIASNGTQVWNRSIPNFRGYSLSLMDSLIYLAAFRKNVSPAYNKGAVFVSDTAGILLHQFTYQKGASETQNKETSEIFDMIIDRDNDKLWLAGKMADPRYQTNSTFSPGIIKTDLDLSWDCRMIPLSESYFSEGIYFESTKTIQSDTLVIPGFSPYAMADSAIHQVDSVLCAEGCNVLTSIFIESDSICSGEPKNLYFSGVNATAFVWSVEGSSDTLSVLPNPVIMLHVPGQTQVRLIASDGLCADTAWINIRVLEKPLVAFWADGPACAGSTEGTLDALPSGGNSPYTVQWSNGSNIPWLTNLPVGYYAATITDDNGCTATGDTTLQADYPALPIAGFQDSTFHLGLHLVNTSQYGVAYEWDFGDGTIVQALESASHLYDLPGNYTVCISASNPCGIHTYCRELTIESCIYYLDNDGDGYGDPLMAVTDCADPSGYVANNQDCNDNEATAYPGATELCDGLDNDCDTVAEDPAICPKPTGLSTTAISATTANIGWNVLLCPSGYRYRYRYETNPGTWSSWSSWTGVNIHTAMLSGLLPGKKYQWQVQSICGNNISASATTNFNTCQYYTFFADNDGDGYGDFSDSLVVACQIQPLGYVGNAQDCQDSDSLIHPGATELCNQLDDNCNDQVDENACDSDGDGFTLSQGDCNDSDFLIHPGAPELCNGTDDNCDNIVDNMSACPKPTGLSSANITSNSAAVSWNYLPCASQYRVRHRYKINGVWSPYSPFSYTVNPQMQLSGLQSNAIYQWQVSARCSNGWSATAVASFVTPSSVQQSPVDRDGAWHSDPPEFAVFPNPAHENLTIHIRGNFEQAWVRCTDIRGVCLYTGALDKDLTAHTFSVAGWPAGIYWLVGWVDGRTWIEQIVVE